MRWLLTYSDMITLLLVFFIILFAMSTIKVTRYEALIQALQDAFTGKKVQVQKVVHPKRAPHAYKQPHQHNYPLPPKSELLRQSANHKLYEELKALVIKDHLQAAVKINQVQYGINIFFLNGVLFASASVHLSARAEQILHDLATVLGPAPNALVVQGYADSLPIDTPEFHSNWDLSVMRAARVADYWMAHGINPDRMIMEGFGKWYPLASNKTPTGMAENRTVRIVVLSRKTSIRGITLGTYGGAYQGHG
jgi:chemotaxis protein MotB